MLTREEADVVAGIRSAARNGGEEADAVLFGPDRAWPAAMYDKIKAVADQHGGVGRGQYFQRSHYGMIPCCIQGIAHIAGGGGGARNEEEYYIGTISDTVKMVRGSGVAAPGNDRIVYLYAQYKGYKEGARCPFPIWAELARVRRID